MEHNWNKEPWSGGAFTSFLIPGTWLPASPRWPGYFEGAIEAGEQAAIDAAC